MRGLCKKGVDPLTQFIPIVEGGEDHRILGGKSIAVSAVGFAGVSCWALILGCGHCCEVLQINRCSKSMPFQELSLMM